MADEKVLPIGLKSKKGANVPPFLFSRIGSLLYNEGFGLRLLPGNYYFIQTLA